MLSRMFARVATVRQVALKGAAGLGPSAHVDTFARDNLPPAEQWPDLLLDRPEFQYSEYLKAAAAPTRSWPTGATGWRTRWWRTSASSPATACSSDRATTPPWSRRGWRR